MYVTIFSFHLRLLLLLHSAAVRVKMLQTWAVAAIERRMFAWNRQGGKNRWSIRICIIIRIIIIMIGIRKWARGRAIKVRKEKHTRRCRCRAVVVARFLCMHAATKHKHTHRYVTCWLVGCCSVYFSHRIVSTPMCIIGFKILLVTLHASGVCIIL